MKVCETCKGHGYLLSDSGPAPREAECYDCEGAGSWEDETEHPRPDEPFGENTILYRGWEAGWDKQREFWTGSGYVAYRGGCDLGALHVSAGTWNELLDEIDAEEDE